MIQSIGRIEPPPQYLSTEPPEVIAELAANLRAVVVGQDAALSAIASAVCRYSAGLAGRERPVATFLLLGPTGSGKTLTAEALAECLHGSRRAVLKIQCAEFQHSHEISKLLGAPSGYVGHKETAPLLCEKALREVRLKHELAIVLFDEIEKAHDAIRAFLLGIMDNGIATMGDGNKSDFRHCILMLTGNIGAAEMERAMSGRTIGLVQRDCSDVSQFTSSESAKFFSPEFRNRLTATITYAPLTDEQLEEVTRRELLRLISLCASREERVRLFFSDAAVKQIATDGTRDKKFGGRGIKRSIERLVEEPLANILASGRVSAGDAIEIYAGDPLRFLRVRPEPAPVSEVAQ